jgi:cellulose 1,4-beta-cellobiosidase
MHFFQANILGWNGTSSNSGSGQYGACCSEMDIWEANSNAAAYTPHPCTGTGLTRCTGADCGDGDHRYDAVCDKDGCDFNSWRMGDQTFLGKGKTIDTSKKITVVTQFITTDGTSSGDLSEIRRLYVQNGQVIKNSQSTISGVTGVKPSSLVLRPLLTLFPFRTRLLTTFVPQPRRPSATETDLLIVAA